MSVFTVLLRISRITNVICSNTANSIYIASIPGVQSHFHISTTFAASPITFFMVGFAIGPVIGTAGSEFFGREYLFKGLLLVSLAFTIVGGSATDFRTLIVARVFAGLTAAPCSTIALGILNDLWDLRSGELIGNLFLLIYALLLTWVSEVGPAMGAAIVRDRDWRWTFWLSAILLAVALVTAIPVPETFQPEIIRRRAGKPRPKIQDVLIPTLSRPLHMLIFEPIVLPTAMLVTISQVVLFFFYLAFPVILQSQYNFSLYSVGMAFLGLFVGSFLALPIAIFLTKVRYQPALLKAETEPNGYDRVPEERLWGAMLGSVLGPVSLFWFAWTARSDIPWIVPIIASAFYGISFSLVQICLPIYKNDSFGATYGASSLAADTFVRFGCSSVVPLFSVQMIDKLTFKWAMSFWAFVSIAVLPVPFVLYYWGPKLRARSRYIQ
ncbi:MFS general substrate transporter [Rhizodiscina lignyota]|uniref:MFS general substrate transporter n=1 Tax=Rhizodiscina lignyota TaxID=1504668 RepID=A0A9P4I778_9PEZI|nr:MFS general substrate transporter [Rhizodiscina lignyota]